MDGVKPALAHMKAAIEADRAVKAGDHSRATEALEGFRQAVQLLDPFNDAIAALSQADQDKLLQKRSQAQKRIVKLEKLAAPAPVAEPEQRDEEEQQLKVPEPHGYDTANPQAATGGKKARGNSPTAAEIAAAMKKKLGQSPRPEPEPEPASAAEPPSLLAGDLDDLEGLADGMCHLLLVLPPEFSAVAALFDRLGNQGY